MSKPLVSIILPVYNAQNHIARCLESICAQSWQNIEVIVLNDGSKCAKRSAQRTSASCWWTRPTPACPTPATWA